MNKHHITSTLACAALGFAPAVATQAQVVPDAGSVLRDQQKPALEVPLRPALPLKFEEDVRPALKPSDTRMVLGSIRISGNNVFPQFELLALVQDYVGKEVGIDELHEAAARITRHYRERGYMVARAYLAQAYLLAPDRTDGIAEITIVEGRFGTVNTTNRSRLRDGVARNYMESFPGAVVREADLERKLLLLGDLAGVGEARSSMRAGANTGETDLTVDVRAAPMVSGSVELDNFGNRFTGANRLGVRLDVANPLGFGDALAVRFTKGFAGMEFGRVGYQAPVGSDGLRLGVAASASRYRLGKSFEALDARGESASTSLMMSYPFIRSRDVNLYGQLSHDRSQFEDRVNATATVTDKQTRVTQFALSGDARDGSGGITAFYLNHSGGRTNIETPEARAADDASARTHGHYRKWTMNLLRLQSLGENTSAYVSFSGQAASKNLDSSEKFVLGGAHGVRAYPQGEASGDAGYVATVELRHSLRVKALPGVLQPFVFVDTGSVKINERPFIAGSNRRHLSGGGMGVTWTKAADFQVKLTLATRLGRQPAMSDTDRHTRGWVQVIKHF